MIRNFLLRLGLWVFAGIFAISIVASVLSALSRYLAWFLLLADCGIIGWRIAERWNRLSASPSPASGPPPPTPDPPPNPNPPPSQQPPPNQNPPPREETPPAQEPPPSQQPPPTERRPAFRVTQKQEEDAADKAFAELEAMVGLDSVKKELNTLMARLRIEREKRAHGLAVSPVSLHMVFTGPPGVGKTVAARALGAIYRSVGALKKGHVIETDRSGLVGEYVGHTAPKTLAKIREAEGGILFIDEAYSLLTDGGGAHNFGAEVITTLLKAMEDMRDRLVVIVAGYPADMLKFIDSNPGLRSRFTKTISFPAYNASELLEIFRRMLAKEHLQLTGDAKKIESELTGWFDSQLRNPSFGNARDVRTLVDRVREAQAIRIDKQGYQDPRELRLATEADVREALEAMT